MNASTTRRGASSHPAPETATQVLDVAERLAQTRGFNGFSYADIAGELGITKASLHYHFPSKANLGCAIVERYSKAFADCLVQIDASGVEAPVALQRYVELYASVLRDGRICLCGMLAAEFTTLPDGMRQAIRAFFEHNESWLTRLFDSGARAKTLEFQGEPRDAARLLTAGLEGAMLLARPYADPARFAQAAAHLLREFVPVSSVRSRRAAGGSGAPKRRDR
jgi:TetR/AcrR family transcriptional repressor of nem operon